MLHLAIGPEITKQSLQKKCFQLRWHRHQKIILVIISALVNRFGVSRMQYFFFYQNIPSKAKCANKTFWDFLFFHSKYSSFTTYKRKFASLTFAEFHKLSWHCLKFCKSEDMEEISERHRDSDLQWKRSTLYIYILCFFCKTWPFI